MLFDATATLSRPSKYDPDRSSHTKCDVLELVSIHYNVSLVSQALLITLLTVPGGDVKTQTITVGPEDAIRLGEELVDAGKRALQDLELLKREKIR